MPIPRHYSYGARKLNIILTQFRCNTSFLNYDLCKVKIISNASCSCGAPCGNSQHFFFDCNKCGHRNVLSKTQVWMSIFHIINLKKKKKNHGHRGPGFFFLIKKRILDYHFCLKSGPVFLFQIFIIAPPPLPLPRDIKLFINNKFRFSI